MRVKGRSVKHANALAEQLAKITQKARNSKRIAARAPLPRVDIVSESLCDDVISYLSPTLDKHKGCTLIDLQPGACLFSSKLHDYLKPKRHVLIEPEDHYYKPFIKPLLDQPKSTYSYTRLNIAHQSSYWEEFQRIQNDPNLLPVQHQLAHDDPAKRQLDPNMLIIGNLAREPRVKIKTHKVDLAPVFLFNMAYHMLANRSVHNGGLVRMLFWLPERYKPYIFSILPWFRTGLQVSLDLSMHTSEAVSVQSLESVFQQRSLVNRRRMNSALLEKLSNQEVAANMRELGLIVPPGRELDIPSVNLPDEVKNITPLSPFRYDIKTPRQLQEKIDMIRARISTCTPWIQHKTTGSEPILSTLEYPQASFAADEYGKDLKPPLKWWRAAVLLDLALRIIHVEANFKALEENTKMDRKTINNLHTAILTLDTEFTSFCNIAAIRIQNAFHAIFDDQLAFFLSPRLVNFPSRSYEPLKTLPSSFHPPQNLSLFDFVPKTRSLSVPDLATSDECSRFCAQLVTVLFSARGQPLPQVLDRIGVNAAKDLIPMVPAITDARRGGRLNPMNLRVRMVTEEMLEGLVKAFFEWPFRPRSWEVVLSNVDARGVEEEEVEGEAEVGR